MIKKEITKNKNLKMNLALIALGISMVIGCPASSNSTGDSDTTAPTLSSSFPNSGAMDFPANSAITLTYSETVQAGSGGITITPTVAGTPQVSIADNVVTINPANDLVAGTRYTLTISAGAFMDAAGNKTAEDTLSFTAAALDETAPTFSSSVPAADATDINASLNIILTYDEPVQAGTGDITLTPTMPSGGAAITIAVGDAQVSIAGAVVTINPTNSLAVSTTYTLTVADGAFMDAAGNKTAELTRSFRTAANIVPEVISSVPVAGATDFPINSTFTLTFSEAVQVGTGNIEISRAGLITRILVGGGSVSISGAVVTIILPSPITLLENTAYTMSFDAGVFESSTDQTPAPAFSLNFSTLDATAPTLSSSVPASGATAAIADRDITLTYSEAVQAGTGNITLTPMGDGTPLTIVVTDAQVSVSATVVTINPTANLGLSTQYILAIPAGAFSDLNGNTSLAETVSFRTAATLDTTGPMLVSSLPANAATGFSADGIIVLTFNELVQAGTEEIHLSRRISPGNRSIMRIFASNPQVSFMGNMVSIDLTDNLVLDDDSYQLRPLDGAFTDASGNASDDFTVSFSTAATLDKTTPTLSSSAPASGATDVDLNANIVLTYDEPLIKGSGDITLTPMGGGTSLTIPVSSAQVSVSADSTVVTIDPSTNLELNTQYDLLIPAGGFTDPSGNPAPGLTRSFTTVAIFLPEVISSVPADDGGTLNVSVDGSGSIVTLVYNQDILKGTGNIMLRTSANAGVIDIFPNIDVNSSLVSIFGNVVTIDISALVVVDPCCLITAFGLTVPAAAFKNKANENPLRSFTLEFITQR